MVACKVESECIISIKVVKTNSFKLWIKRLRVALAQLIGGEALDEEFEREYADE